MKRLIVGLLVVVAAVSVLAMDTDGPLTTLANLAMMTDSNGYLLVSNTGTPTGQSSPATTMSNLSGRTDSNGYLLVTLGAMATPLLLADGSQAAPSWAFTSETGLGAYRSRTNAMDWVLGGNTYYRFDTTGVVLAPTVALGWNSSTIGPSSASAADVNLTRTAAGAVKLSQTATTTAELQVSGGNGGFISSVKALTELTTIAASPTTNTAIQIPANSIVLGVSVRVVTVIPTAATFTVTSATPTKTWNTAAVTVAANSTDPGTLGAPSFQTTASAITITPNLTPGAATGQVRVTIFYYTITPPTS